MTPLQELTQKIHTHCPELTGLHFFETGHAKCTYCDTPRIVRDERHKTIVIDDKSGWSVGEITVTEYDQTDMPCTKNHWKPITLEHVLKAIRKLNDDGKLEGKMGTCGIYDLWDDASEYILSEWEMCKPLSEQSEETIKWLNEIIT